LFRSTAGTDALPVKVLMQVKLATVFPLAVLVVVTEPLAMGVERASSD